MKLFVAAGLALAAAAPLSAAGESALEPGLYEERTEITCAILAGSPAALPLPAPTVRRFCLGADDAAEPSRLFAARETGDCSTDRAKVGFGKVSLSGVCEDRSGTTAVTATAGRYDASGYALDVDTRLLASPKPLVVKSRVVASRVGECAPAQAASGSGSSSSTSTAAG